MSYIITKIKFNQVADCKTIQKQIKSKTKLFKDRNKLDANQLKVKD